MKGEVIINMSELPGDLVTEVERWSKLFTLTPDLAKVVLRVQSLRVSVEIYPEAELEKLSRYTAQFEEIIHIVKSLGNRVIVVEFNSSRPYGTSKGRLWVTLRVGKEYVEFALNEESIKAYSEYGIVTSEGIYTDPHKLKKALSVREVDYGPDA